MASFDEASEPLTEVTYYILLSLAPQAKHGYAIMKDVRFLSDGRINLSTGTLYGALKRLLEQDLIQRVEEVQVAAGQPADGPGRTRKAYSLTGLGRRMLRSEVQRLRTLVAAAQLRPVEE